MFFSSKKSDPHAFAHLLLLIAVPLAVTGAVQTSAMVLHSVPSAEQTRVPKQFQFELFDLQEFKQLRRAVHADEVPAEHDAASQTESVPASSPCETVAPAVESLQESATPELSVGDLTSSQRETLRRQLRNHACPQRADSAYKALCESLLSEQDAFEVRQGLRNPNQ